MSKSNTETASALISEYQDLLDDASTQAWELNQWVRRALQCDKTPASVAVSLSPRGLAMRLSRRVFS